MTQIRKCPFRILFNPLWNVSVSTQHAGTKSNSLDVWPSLEWLWLRCFITKKGLFEPEHFLKSILPSGKFFLAIQQSLYVLRRQHFGFDWLKFLPILNYFSDIMLTYLGTLISLINVGPTLTEFEKFQPPRLLIP